MKIKETNTSVSLKNIPFIFFLASLVCIVLRSFQMLKFIDPATGFYTGGGIVTAILYAVLLISSLVIVAMSFLSAESAKIQVQGVKNTAAGAATLAFSLSLLYDFIAAFMGAGDNLAYVGSATGFKGLMQSGAMPSFFQSVFALISAFYFLLLAKDFFKGTSKASKHRLLALAPVAWAGFRLILRFVRQISFIRVSDLFLELVMLACMLLFFMAFAQVAGGVYSDGFRWRIPAFGSVAALIAITLSVSRLIFTFIDSGSFINPDHPFILADFVFALFAALMIKFLCKNLSPYTSVSYEDKETEQ